MTKTVKLSRRIAMIVMAAVVAMAMCIAVNTNGADAKNIKSPKAYLEKWNVKASKKGYSYIQGTVHYPKGASFVTVEAKLGKKNIFFICLSDTKAADSAVKVDPKKTSKKIKLYFYNNATKKKNVKTDALKKLKVSAYKLKKDGSSDRYYSTVKAKANINYDSALQDTAASVQQ